MSQRTRHDESSEPAGMNTATSGLLILLAEDEPADAHLLCVALHENRIEAEVQHVFDGREALEYLRRQGGRFAEAQRPDLILLDLNMPRMDGREFLAALQDDVSLREIPVVVLSTSEVERDVLAAHRLGAAGYIAKSPDVGVFIEEVGRPGDYWSRLVRLPHNGEWVLREQDGSETKR